MATKRTDAKTGRTYYESSVRFYRADGSVHRKWVRGRTKAEHDKRRVRMLDERDGSPKGVSRGAGRVETLADLAELYIERHVKLKHRSTQDLYMNAIELRIAPYLFHVKLAELTPEVVETWIASLVAEQRPRLVRAGSEMVPILDPAGKPLMERSHGTRSINVARQVLVGMLNKGKKWRYVADNAAQESDRLPEITRQPRVFEPELVQDLALMTYRRRFERVGKRGGQGEPYARRWGARDATMVLVLAFTGLRLGELVALRWGDIQESEIRVMHSLNEATGELGTTKTKVERHVPLLEPARIALDTWRLSCPDTSRSAWVFPSDRIVTALRQNTWRERVFKPSARLAGLEDARPHDMRHTFASLMIAKGVTPLRLSQWMGHSDPVTTMRRYAHLFARVESDIVAKVNAQLVG